MRRKLSPYIRLSIIVTCCLISHTLTGTEQHDSRKTGDKKTVTFGSVALDSTQNPHIIYSAPSGLKSARKAGSKWVIETADSTESSKHSDCLVFDSSGNPHVSYYDPVNGLLKYAHWTGKTWTVQTIDSCSRETDTQHPAARPRTTWRCYFGFYGNTAALPLRFETDAVKFILAYRGIGIGSSVAQVHAIDMTGGDFLDNHKFTLSWAPTYLYYIPFASHRRLGDVTPLVTCAFIGGSAWGMSNAKLFDVGLACTLYLLDFRVGYGSITASSRNPFMTTENFEDAKLHDYPVRHRAFYASIGLSTGFWLSL